GTTVLALLAVSANGTTQMLAGTSGNGVLRWSGSAWQLDGLAGSEVVALSSWNATVYAGTNHKVWEYTFVAPPTPTPTSTVTATPTPTITPTPGLRSFVLRNEPFGEINPGEEITYQISYHNGSAALSAFEITNVIPNDVQLVPGSISNGGSSTGIQPGDTVRWALGTLATNATGTVSYRVQRPGNTPTRTSTATPTFHSPQAGPGSVEFDPAASYTVVVITNDGAMATWTVNNIPDQTNTVSNPSRRVYLPLLLR
ncbi:MAG: hypothetical protein WAZ19_09185, partial [Anaerolineae bacterium]